MTILTPGILGISFICAFAYDASSRLYYRFVYERLAVGTQTSIDTLVDGGQKHFGIYKKILTSGQPSWPIAVSIYRVLRRVDADKTAFRGPTVALLNSSDSHLRHVAVSYLADFGTSQDASPVVALLWDKDSSTVYMAAKTLSIIGTQQELVALNIWLARGPYPAVSPPWVWIRGHVIRFRDQLKMRLDKDWNRFRWPP